MSDTIGSEECADMLRCTVDQVEELARCGDIPGLKIGRSWLFMRDDLLDYLAEKAREEAQERRSMRQPGVTPIVKQKSRRPPALPTFLPQGQCPETKRTSAPLSSSSTTP